MPCERFGHDEEGGLDARRSKGPERPTPSADRLNPQHAPGARTETAFRRCRTHAIQSNELISSSKTKGYLWRVSPMRGQATCACIVPRNIATPLTEIHPPVGELFDANAIPARWCRVARPHPHTGRGVRRGERMPSAGTAVYHARPPQRPRAASRPDPPGSAGARDPSFEGALPAVQSRREEYATPSRLRT